MKANREPFIREYTLRIQNKLDNQFVIGVLRFHDSDLDPNFAQDLRNRGFGAYPYVLVMTGKRNLAPQCMQSLL
jgi:hypothetical protein